MRLKMLLAVCVLVLLVPMARAQNGVYATYTSANMTNIGGDVPHMNGATVGFFLQDRRARVFKGGVDFRGNFLNGNYNTSSDQGLAGLRLVVLPPHTHIAPYGEILIGVANSQLFTNGRGESHFITAFVAGADYQLARRVDWRVVDFTYSRVEASSPFNPIMVSTGLVFRFR